MNTLAFIAAHAGFALDRVPLGGGASVADHLIQEWRQTHPFKVHVISPSVLAEQAPNEFDLVRMSEWRYARFCLAFEKAATQAVLSKNPPSAPVLCNDVSEGPDVHRLAEAGYAVFTIYHVDVLDYVCRLYLRGAISPVRLAAGYRWLEKSPIARLLPDVAKLVLKKQEHSVRYSKGLIVPSAAMRDVLMDCYPQTDSSRIHVIPWGIWSPALISSESVESEKAFFFSQWADRPHAKVLLTLSRISPEKGQDRLLEALSIWEKQRDYPEEGLVCVIAGEAAYMQGQRFEAFLRKKARRLRRTKVIFAGYAAGARKEALWRLAHVYVFPSRHESYGLTMMEAMRAGVPVLCTPTHGAREIFKPDYGWMTLDVEGVRVPEQLCQMLQFIHSHETLRHQKGEAGKRFACREPFSKSAAQVAELLKKA